MRIIKVNAINSTNSFIRKFYEGTSNFQPVCVWALNQTKGRGQRGSSWVTEAGENLTFSVLYPQKRLNISRHFYLSATVSLALLDSLDTFEISKLKVKWPNDILSAKFKIGGILIENIVKQEIIVASIIGIGLNVNQGNFETLPNAGSMKTVTGKSFDLENILQSVLLNIENKLDELPEMKEKDILESYTKKMFRLNQVSVFQLPNGKRINGIIRGVTTMGKLNLEIEDAVFKTFELKEIQLLY